MDISGDSVVSGSADADVKFWTIGMAPIDNDSLDTNGNDTSTTESGGSNMAFTLVHTKTLKMSDDVLCIKHSPDGKLLCVSLLDCSIKVFYKDSLKFFLNLYGHGLPVLTMDISSDSLLLVSGGADKSVRVWGLDFGDCRKSMRGHTDSVI